MHERGRPRSNPRGARAAESVRTFFEPASVAVIGASRREGSIGSAIVANLKRSGFAGPIYPVNAAAAEIEGLPCFASVAATKAKIDLAVIAVPAARVEEVALECAQAGVRGVVVISSGFAESSPRSRSSGPAATPRAHLGYEDGRSELHGLAQQRSGGPSERHARAHVAPRRKRVDALPERHPRNGHPGPRGASQHRDREVHFGRQQGRPLRQRSPLVLGRRSADFARIAPEVARKKPIVAVKSGRSAAGTRAAASHSASLASLDVGVDALFAQAGVVRTNTLEELFDVVALLSTQPLPRGPRVGVVTNAGGPGILLADACEARRRSPAARRPFRRTSRSRRSSCPRRIPRRPSRAGRAARSRRTRSRRTTLDRETLVAVRDIVDRLSANARSPSWVPAEDVGRILALAGVRLAEQRSIEGGIEAIVGVTMDPSMGPILVAGFGGVLVELLRDVAFRLAPVSDTDVAEMLDGLRAAKLLDVFRGAPPADRAALVASITRVSALVAIMPELLELELNPLKVLARGEGVVGVDARMRIGPA